MFIEQDLERDDARLAESTAWGVLPQTAAQRRPTGVDGS
jgi:hypothetical protein